MTRHRFAIFSLATALALTGCENAAGDPSTANGPETEPPKIVSIEALAGQELNLARVGREDDGRGYISKGSSHIVTDLWLIERATGTTYSLLPDAPGRVSESHFVSDTVGPVREVDRYGRGVSSDDETAEFYIISVSDASDQIQLFAGSLSDKATEKLGGPYRSIQHMDLLGEGRLAVYAERADKTFRIEFDLNSLTEIGQREVTP